MLNLDNLMFGISGCNGEEAGGQGIQSATNHINWDLDVPSTSVHKESDAVEPSVGQMNASIMTAIPS